MLFSSSGIVYPQRGQCLVAQPPKATGHPCSRQELPPGTYSKAQSGQLTTEAGTSATGAAVTAPPRGR
jgi:hypothetical protein